MWLETYYETFRTICSWGLIGIACFGIPINLLPLWLIWRRKGSLSNFHILLLILSLSDLIVVAGCLTIYGLADVWPSFNFHTYPHIAPWLIPVLQIALLTSMYATVLLSFERYVRIVYTCNLKHFKYFNEDNFKFYVWAVLTIPTLFYLPKFFEYKSVSVVRGYNYVNLDCDQDDDLENCINKAENSTSPWPQVLTRYFNQTELAFTSLRHNYFYRKIYHLVLNTIVGSLIPMVTLMYLNISTIRAIRQRTESTQFELKTFRPNSRAACKVLRTGSYQERPGKTVNSVQIEVDDDEEVASNHHDLIEQRSDNHLDVQENQESPKKVCSWFAKRVLNKNERTLTRVSVFIVWIFLACHVWRVIPNIYEAFKWDDENSPWPKWLDYFVIMSHLSIVVSSSLNFVVYLIF